MMSRRITLAIAAAVLATILAGVLVFALMTNEPTAVSAAPILTTTPHGAQWTVSLTD